MRTVQMMGVFGLAGLVLAGCDGGEVKLGDSGTTAPKCEITVTGTDPADGATDIVLNATVSFTLSEVDDTASISADYDGAMTASEDGLTLTWTPTGALTAETTYTVTLDFCGGSESIGGRFRRYCRGRG